MNEFPTRAFFAFSVALAASAWALFAELGKPYLPSIPIILYTLYLYANRTSVGQQENDALKDSPYFLGFLLTMFGLFKIFKDVSFNFALFGQNPQLMTEEVAGAVLTTIVGLFSRQALLGLVRDESPAEDDRLAALASAVTSHAVAFEVARQQFFREMADERTKQARELEATQERFLSRLDDLTRSVPIIGAPATHAEAGYALAERPGAIVVGATPRPTVGFAVDAPGTKPAGSHNRRASESGFDRVAPSDPKSGTQSIVMSSGDALSSAYDFPPAGTEMSSQIEAAPALSVTAPFVAESIALPVTPRTFEPMASAVTPPPGSGKSPADWIVAASRPDSLGPTPTPTPASQARMSGEDQRADRPRPIGSVAAPYVRPVRGTPGFGDVT